MSQPCPRCGFPNGPTARRCRACSATLDAGAVRLSPKLRAVLNKARNQGGGETRVDRLPGRIPSPQQIRARREALTSERQSGLTKLRQRLDHLERNRPKVSAPEHLQYRPPERPVTLAKGMEVDRSVVIPAARGRDGNLPQNHAIVSPSFESETMAKVAPIDVDASRGDDQGALSVVPFESSRAAGASNSMPTEPVVIASEVDGNREEVLPVSAVANTETEKPEPPNDQNMRSEEEVPLALAVEDEFRSSEPFLLSDLGSASLPAENQDDFRSSEPFLLSDFKPIESDSDVLPVVGDLPCDGIGEFVSEVDLASISTLPSEIDQDIETSTDHRVVEAENDETAELESLDLQGTALGRFGWRRTGACFVDLLLPAGVFSLVVLGSGAPQNKPPEEWVAHLLLGESGGFGLGLGLFLMTWLLSAGGSSLWLQRSFGMWVFGLRWSDSSRLRLLMRIPLSIVCLLPLGIGLSWAWVDSNSRTLADHILGLRWLGPEHRS
ncbi:MAG: RDD family protein [Myxococcota bacterium]|nr:RDD family protein [Myxococcota bacterium]